MKKKKLNLVIIIFLFLICSCSDNSRIIILKTNLAVFSAYVEYFNSIKSNYKIQIVYKDEPASVFQDSKNKPDILIYKNLATIGLLSNFEPLDQFLKPSIIPPESIYPLLLETAYFKRKCLVLPLSFSLPMVVFNNKNKESDIVSLVMPLDVLKTKALKFNTSDNRKLGFFPFWDDEFIFSASVLLGVNFKLDNNKLSWNKKALSDSVIFFKNWLTEIKGGYDAGRDFFNKYMNIPAYKLLEQEKILYYFTSSEYLYNIPKEKRKNIDFRWLSYNHKIPVNDNITYAAIPKNARYKKEAGEFLQWLFSPSVQSSLLKVNNYKQISAIWGIANEFSSIIEVNEKYIPQYNPALVGYIPEKDFLLFPNQLPDNWKKIKENIIKKWIVESIISDTNDKDLEDLIRF